MESPAPLPEKPRNWILLLFLPVFFAFGLGSGYLIWGRGNVPAAAASEVQIPDRVTRYDVPTDNDPSLGPAGAPITLIEFGDYECPFCRKWNTDVLRELMTQFPGKIRFVYRDFPLASIHPDASSAAEAADCAGEQNAYWKFHDVLFSLKYGLGAAAYPKYAGDLGLDLQSFNQCITDRRYAAEVQADSDYAMKLGINSTPTFFLNGIPIIGAQPYDIFKQIVDKELAGEIPK